MMNKRLILGIGFVLLFVGGAIGIAKWLTSSYTFNGVINEPALPATDFTLTDEDNLPFALHDLQGKWILLAYGYTTCPDICPATLAILSRVAKNLGDRADEIAVVFVTVDPERDTSERLKEYVGHFNPEFKGLTGTPPQIAAAAYGYGVKYARQEEDSAVGYLMSHSAYVYLINPEFQWQLTYPFGIKPDEISADLTYLINHSKKEN